MTEYDYLVKFFDENGNFLTSNNYTVSAFDSYQSKIEINSICEDEEDYNGYSDWDATLINS